MNSKEIKAYNLPKDQRIIYHMETKPYILLGIFLTVGFLMFMVNGMLAIVICSVVIYAIILLPSKVLLDFTDDYLIMYNRSSKNDCVMIYYNEIVSWTYRKDIREDELIVELVDGSTEKVECYSRTKVRRIMSTFARDKEIKVKK